MIFTSQFIFGPTRRFPASHAANLAVLPEGHLGFVCFRGQVEGSADNIISMQTLSGDGTWSRPRVVVDDPEGAAGNAVLMPLPDGRVALFYVLSHVEPAGRWANSLIYFRFSEDNGKTWGERRALTEEFGFLCRQPGLILANGEWLLPAYDNRVGSAQSPGIGCHEGSVWVSADSGKNWRRYGRMAADAGTAQPSVVEIRPGHLRAWLRTRNFWNGENPAWAFIYRSESFDNGRNWTRPQPTLLPNNNSSIQVCRLKSGALALVYNHQSGRMRSPLNIALSYDNGENWPVMREIEPFSPEGNEYSYPAIAQTPDGLIHVAYTYLRTHMKHVVVDQEWIEAAC
jgi:predicted neuraminidase